MVNKEYKTNTFVRATRLEIIKESRRQTAKVQVTAVNKR